MEVLKHHTHFFPHYIKLLIRHGSQILPLKENLSGGGLLQPVQTT